MPSNALLHNGEQARSQAQLDETSMSVAQVLNEFVSSDYVRRVCDSCMVSPTDYGSMRGLFESVRVEDGRLIVRLARQVEEKSASLLDRLARHLRKRMPQIKRLEVETRSPPSTRTIIL